MHHFTSTHTHTHTLVLIINSALITKKEVPNISHRERLQQSEFKDTMKVCVGETENGQSTKSTNRNISIDDEWKKKI